MSGKKSSNKMGAQGCKTGKEKGGGPNQKENYFNGKANQNLISKGIVWVGYAQTGKA